MLGSVEEEYAKLKAEYARQFVEEAAGAAEQLRVYDVLISDAERDCSGIGGVSYDKAGTNPNAYVDGVHDQAMRMSSSLARWRDGRKSAAAVVDAASRAIANVPDVKSRQLLELRYLDGFSWKHVASTMALSESRVKHMRFDALVSLHDFMPERFRLPSYDAFERA